VSEGTNPKAFENAAELALRNGSVDIALGMFDYLKKNDHTIKQHYFWPLFVAKIKQDDFDGNLFVRYFICVNINTWIKKMFVI